MAPDKKVKRHIVGEIVDDVRNAYVFVFQTKFWQLIFKKFFIKRNQTYLFVTVRNTETKLIPWSTPPYRRMPFIIKWIRNKYKLFSLPSITCALSPLPRPRVLAPIKTQKNILTPTISLRQRKFQEKKAMLRRKLERGFRRGVRWTSQKWR